MLTARMVDNAPLPTGRVCYEVRRRGIVVERIDEQNLVVAQATTILANALGGVTASGVVTLFGVGTNLAAPAPGNTTLTGSYTNTLAGAAYAAGQVIFSFALGSGEANGVSIGEFGLLTASGLLFARKVRQALLPKTADITLGGTWTITW